MSPYETNTPKTLKQAVLEAVSMVPFCDIAHVGPMVIRNFLANRFAVAYLKVTTPEELERLKELWRSIVGEDDKP